MISNNPGKVAGIPLLMIVAKPVFSGGHISTKANS